VTRVVVKPDDQNPGMMADRSHDQVGHGGLRSPRNPELELGEPDR
jgi:hypothetical protein